jgi:hypothetical protein
MKQIIVALLCAGIAGLSLAQEAEPVSFTAACAGGGQKAVTYDWTVFSSAISYTATLTDCTPAGDDRKFNGSITGNGTLTPSASGFAVFMTVQEDLTVSGVDTGSISCTTGLQGEFNTTNASFNGTVTKNNCSFTVNATSVDLVELLTDISYQ